MDLWERTDDLCWDVERGTTAAPVSTFESAAASKVAAEVLANSARKANTFQPPQWVRGRAVMDDDAPVLLPSALPANTGSYGSPLCDKPPLLYAVSPAVACDQVDNADMEPFLHLQRER